MEGEGSRSHGGGAVFRGLEKEPSPAGGARELQSRPLPAQGTAPPG
jgi:hypothetical protein